MSKKRMADDIMKVRTSWKSEMLLLVMIMLKLTNVY